jgi:hypothetical protein
MFLGLMKDLLVEGGKVNATLPMAMDSDHQGMFDQLKGKSGKDPSERGKRA